MDAQSKSLHFFNYYGVRSRIDVTNLDDHPSLPDFTSFEADKLLPTKDDDAALLSDFTIIVGRVLRKHFSSFNKFGSGIQRHIRHQYYPEMSQKSEVVCEFCQCINRCIVRT